MKSMAWALLFFAAAAFAQVAKDKEVSKPADGALKGGSIPAPDKRAEQRCNELSGTLREQCLEQRNVPAPAGATRAPGEPPPQEPRQEKQ